MNIDSIMDQAHETSVEKGWWKTERTFGDHCALFHSEISEALEAYRREGHVRIVPLVNGGKGGVPIELADVIIRIADFCAAQDIDLEMAIRYKLGFNQTRSHRHGGKAI